MRIPWPVQGSWPASLAASWRTLRNLGFVRGRKVLPNLYAKRCWSGGGLFTVK